MHCNSSHLNRENYDPDLNLHRFLWFYFSIVSLVLPLIEKINQKLKTMFDPISKHLTVCQKYSPAHCVFNSLLVEHQVSRCLFVCLFATHLFANTGPGTASFKDNDGDTTTVLNVGRKENNKSTVALSERETVIED